MYMSICEVSLLELLHFNSRDDTETSIMKNVDWTIVKSMYKETETKWAEGHYWLGGQIKMNLTDRISLEKIRQAKTIGDNRIKQLGGPANGIELMSIKITKHELILLENVIKNYTQIMKYRVKNMLLDKLNNDTSNYVLGYL